MKLSDADLRVLEYYLDGKNFSKLDSGSIGVFSPIVFPLRSGAVHISDVSIVDVSIIGTVVVGPIILYVHIFSYE